MAYTYGMKGAPAVGQGAPGLPKRWQPEASTYTRIVSGSGVLIPPPGARFMRVAVIGGGAARAGTSTSAPGGGGGGCAASKIVPATSISYAIGAAAAIQNTAGGDTTATFIGYSLIGKGGGSGGIISFGGVGVGGDYNFIGGSSVGSSFTGGGGAAGPNGNGGEGRVDNTATSGSYDGTGWGPGGGAGGIGNQDQVGGGPGSAGYHMTTGPRGGDPFSNLGGGSNSGTSAAGKSGGMVVEWFY